MPCHSILSSISLSIPCHVIISSISSSMWCHHYLCLSLSLSFHHILGYSFVIRELLWHQWQIYYQQYPPLALMETSKHSPPLTTMTKDNLLCYWGFPVFLLSDNSPYHHISPLLTGLGTNQCIIIYLDISFLETSSWMIDPWTPPVTALPLLCQHFCERVYTQHYNVLCFIKKCIM